MSNFEKWNSEFSAQRLYAFNNDANGLLWLKVRAVCRDKQLAKFLSDNHLKLNSRKIAEKNIELFELLEKRGDAKTILDDFLRERNNEWYTAMGVDEEKLKEDLYNVHYYSWGGDQNNSLDKYLVGRYVKVISDYDELLRKSGEIASNAWNYVQNSWYNNWTSYLIESIFKRHKRVISAVGEIKSVDFFIDDYPVDLKVTFFPQQYLKEKLKVKLGKNVLPWLKAQCKRLGITARKEDSESQQIYTLTEKLIEQGHNDIVDVLNNYKKDVVLEAQKNPLDLITWLYAMQGEMRFGAENRLFIILADTKDLSQSWKMKREFKRLEPVVENYLDGFSSSSLKSIDFSYNGRPYTSLADVIFIIK